MQVLHRSAILIFALWLSPNNAFAGNPLQNQELFEKSGLAEQMSQLPAAMQASVGTLRQQGLPIDAKFEKAWADAVPVAYATDKCLTFIDQGVQKLLTAEEKKSLLAHYNSPLGRRITELEIKASRPEAQAEAQAYAQKLMADPSKNSDRLARLQEIDKATGATTLGTEVAMNVAVATSIGMVTASRDRRLWTLAQSRPRSRSSVSS
jgi:hypothetical protein